MSLPVVAFIIALVVCKGKIVPAVIAAIITAVIL